MYMFYKSPLGEGKPGKGHLKWQSCAIKELLETCFELYPMIVPRVLITDQAASHSRAWTIVTAQRLYRAATSVLQQNLTDLMDSSHDFEVPERVQEHCVRTKPGVLSFLFELVVRLRAFAEDEKYLLPSADQQEGSARQTWTRWSQWNWSELSSLMEVFRRKAVGLQDDMLSMLADQYMDSHIVYCGFHVMQLWDRLATKYLVSCPSGGLCFSTTRVTSIRLQVLLCV